MLVELRMNVDTRALRRELSEFERNQLPYAISLSLNRTAEEARAAAQDQVDMKFTVAPSKRTFIRNLVRFDQKDRATKESLRAAVQIGSPERAGGKNEDRSFLLLRHVDGGTQKAVDKDRPFFIPTDEIRGGVYDLAPRVLYPTSTRVQRRDPAGVLGPTVHVTKKGVIQIKGKQRTFVIKPTHGGERGWGVYQRTGPDKRDIRMIWMYRKSIDLKARFDFEGTIRRVVTDRWEINFEGMFDVAMRTAR